MRQIFFRVLGIVTFLAGIFALYDFGLRILPLFELFVSGERDYFELFVVAISFFLGALSLMWVGARMIVLRNFSHTWLHFAIFPIVAWLQGFLGFVLVYDMDLIMSLTVVYVLLYIVILNISLSIRTRMYVPVSHEDMRHVGTVSPNGKHATLLPFLTIVTLATLIAVHPADLDVTLSMLFSPLRHFLIFLLL